MEDYLSIVSESGSKKTVLLKGTPIKKIYFKENKKVPHINLTFCQYWKLWLLALITVSCAMKFPVCCVCFLFQTLTLMNFPFFLVDKATFMVGSYGPRPEEYEFLTPIEEAPKGMLARGTYHNKSFFTDDDKHDHLTWEWNLSIKKEWTE